MNDLYNLASIGNIIIGILLLIGGYMAFRSSHGQQTGNIQAQAIDALKAELEAVQRRIDVVERENTRLHLTINLIKSALKQRGLHVTIDGDMVTIEDRRAGGQSSQYSHIQEVRPPRQQRSHAPWQEETIADMPHARPAEREM